jgi:Uma2 family endonuclease
MSSAVATETRRYTPEDLLAMPDEKSYELVDGRLVYRPSGARCSLVGGDLLVRLHLFCDEHDLGIVWGPDNGFRCFPDDPCRVRRPDGSFVRSGRLPGDISPVGWVEIPPDLAYEVVAPGELAEELESRLIDYRKVGVPLIWVIYPELRVAKVLLRGRPPVELGEDDELSGEDIIPGFRCPLREILPPRAPAEEPGTAPAGPNGAGPA